MKKTILLIFCALLIMPSAVSAKAKKKAKPAPLPTIEILQKVNDQWQSTHSPEVRSFWDDAPYSKFRPISIHSFTGCQNRRQI